jgi:secreted trypsin-like serine protease
VYYPDNYVDSTSQLLPNDIAIFKLEQAISVANHIAIPTNEDYRADGELFQAIGHGNTATNTSSTSKLQKATLTWVDNPTCASNFTGGSNLTEKQICFTGDYSNATGLKAGTCQGDSGGPVYWNENGMQVQVGITSFGPATCGDPGSKVTAVYTEITDYRSWINSVLSGTEQPKRVSDDSIRRSYIDTYGSIINDRNGFEVPSTPKTGGDGGGGGVSYYFAFWLALIATLRSLILLPNWRSWQTKLWRT